MQARARLQPAHASRLATEERAWHGRQAGSPWCSGRRRQSNRHCCWVCRARRRPSWRLSVPSLSPPATARWAGLAGRTTRARTLGPCSSSTRPALHLRVRLEPGACPAAGAALLVGACTERTPPAHLLSPPPPPPPPQVWHNYSFDRHVLERHGLAMRGFGGDTMHMARLWDSSRMMRGGYSLEALSGGGPGRGGAGGALARAGLQQHWSGTHHFEASPSRDFARGGRGGNLAHAAQTARLVGPPPQPTPPPPLPQAIRRSWAARAAPAPRRPCAARSP